MLKRETEPKADADAERGRKITKLLLLDQARVEILGQIADKIEDLVSEQAQLEENYETDGLGSKIKYIFEQILEEFKEFLEENEEKKNFVSGIAKIFAILLSTESSSLAKIKKIVKTSAEIAVKLWSEQKQQ